MIKAPFERTTLDADGKVVKVDTIDWHLLPPEDSLCQVCAFKHDPSEPHNAQTMYYQAAFEMVNGRAPTWADAMAHCDPVVREKWKQQLVDMGHWTEPPAGVAVIEHLGKI